MYQEYQIRQIVEKEIETRMDQQKKENENIQSYFQRKYAFFRDFTTICICGSFCLQFLTIKKQFENFFTFDNILNHTSWIILVSLHLYAIISKNPK